MIKEFHNKLINHEITAQELVESCFKIIEKKDSQIQAFLTLTKKQALEKAKKVDEKIKRGDKIGILEGIPYAVKDNILTKGIKTTAGSRILENYTGTYSATVVEKLEEQGAIILGKTNLDEFAMGSSTENSAFFPTKNPWNLETVPGGSSGGSAASVASGMALFALGSDTGGSIRQPAAFCGIVGFKPSYGVVSRFGLIAMASSLDQIGTLAQTVEDAEIVFQVIAGQDKMDSTSCDLKQIQDTRCKIQDIRFGLPREYFIEGLDEEISEEIKLVLEKIEKEGIKTKEVSLPLTSYALPCYYIIMPAEVSSNLARYDGIRYAEIKNLKSEVKNLSDLYFKTRGQGFGKEVKRRIILGTYVLSKGYYDAYYKKAQKVRRLIIEEFEEIFKEVDFLITPTTPTLPFKLGEKSLDPLKMYLSDVFTVGANIAGLPAINLPIGWSQDKLPIGMQIIGPRFADNRVFFIAKAIEELIKSRIKK